MEAASKCGGCSSRSYCGLSGHEVPFSSITLAERDLWVLSAEGVHARCVETRVKVFCVSAGRHRPLQWGCTTFCDSP